MAKTQSVWHFKEIENPQAQTLGSKATNIIRLSKMGLNVPEGFIIDTTAYKEIMYANAWTELVNEKLTDADLTDTQQLNDAASDIRSKILESELPPSIRDEVILRLQDMNAAKIAVRSSATAEDLPDASFAGQYDTFLSLETPDEVLDSIMKCYASLWTPRAIEYRQRIGIPHEGIRLAVIIQNQVDAKSAGVLFTRDPVSPFHDYAVIESSPGLGESVVSGDVTPDRFFIAKSAKENEELLLIRKELNPQFEYTSKSLGDSREPRGSLTDSEAKQIAEIGYKIEDEFGLHQDVEWALDVAGDIHILQTRPITTLAIAEDETYWTRGYSDDYWNDNVTPLFFDLLGDQLTFIVNNELNAIMGYKQMSSELLRLHKAHAYFNLDVLKRKVINEIPPFLRSEDVLNYFPEGGMSYGKETMKDLPFNLKNRLMAEIRVMLFDGNGSMTKTADVYQEWNDEVFVPYCKEFDRKLQDLVENGTNADLMDLADELDKVMIDHFRLVRYGIPVHNIGMNLMSSYLLEKFIGKKNAAKAYPILISGLDHKTSETNKAIHELAELALDKPEVRQVILESQPDEILDILTEEPSQDIEDFLEKYDEFIKDYGVRGFTREPYYQRWKEDSSLVFGVIKSLIRGETKVTQRDKEAIQQKRQRVEKEVQKAIRNQRFGAVKWLLFSTILGFARRYICFREDQRFNLDRWITRNRELFLELGKRLVSLDVLDEPSDIFFLRRDEIRKLTQGQGNIEQIHDRMQKRRNDFQEHEDTTPPKFLVANSEYDDIQIEDEEGVLRGIPASQGEVTGTIRVLTSIREISEVEEGDILVVPKTDPGWTPVFAKIGGLITETGGILSHGAVVSREYGIPAITNIRSACRTFHTGQEVTLNGTKGQIRIH